MGTLEQIIVNIRKAREVVRMKFNRSGMGVVFVSPRICTQILFTHSGVILSALWEKMKREALQFTDAIYWRIIPNIFYTHTGTQMLLKDHASAFQTRPAICPPGLKVQSTVNDFFFTHKNNPLFHDKIQST